MQLYLYESSTDSFIVFEHRYLYTPTQTLYPIQSVSRRSHVWIPPVELGRGYPMLLLNGPAVVAVRNKVRCYSSGCS